MKRYFTLNVFLFALLSFSTSAQINPNGGFEQSEPGVYTGTDLTGWFLPVEGGSQATFEVITDPDYVHSGEKALQITITSLGANDWEPQAINSEFDVLDNTTYTVSAWAKTDVEGVRAHFTFGSLAPNYHEWGRVGSFPLTLDWQNVTFQITTRNPEPEPIGGIPIHFGLAENGSLLPFTVYLDDIEVFEGAVGVKESRGAGTPMSFSLSQNYPNPFNPVTKFSFSIPERNNVRVVLVNMLGETVREVVNRFYAAGTHEVIIDGSSLASGVYFYRLEAGSFTATKKLVLMK